LADWPRDGRPLSYVSLSEAVDGLVGKVSGEAVQRMLWVASSVAAALRDGALQTVPALHDAFAGVAREVRRAVAGAPPTGRAEAVLEPTRELLYQVAHGGGDHPALRALRDTFELERQVQAPSESELAHAQGSLSGHNRALLDTVSGAIKEDLLRVKDALDLHLRSGQSDVSGLQPQSQALATIADTLGMLGLEGARELVQRQRDTLDGMLHGAGGVDEGTLLDIAAALLFVDASLDEQVERLGAPAGSDDLLANESRKVTEALAREAIANFADARQAFVAFVETNWDHAELAEVPRLLGEVSGALQMLDLPQPAHYLAGVRAYTERELIGKARVPSGRPLDTLADALASLAHYLEALREQRPNRGDILDVARHSRAALHYSPVPEPPATWPPPRASWPAARTRAPPRQRPRPRRPRRRRCQRLRRRRRTPRHRSAPATPVASRPPATRSTTRSARSSSRSSRRRSRTCRRCSPSGVPIPSRSNSCARSAACSIPSRAADAWSAPRCWASSRGRSRTCSTACSTARARPAPPWWPWSAPPTTRGRNCCRRCAVTAAWSPTWPASRRWPIASRPARRLSSRRRPPQRPSPPPNPTPHPTLRPPRPRSGPRQTKHPRLPRPKPRAFRPAWTPCCWRSW